MKKIPFLYRMIQGAIGKRFVVKHYRGGRIVVTKFPDMSGIVASGKQRERRDLFREAVVYGKWIVADVERKKAFRKTLSWKKRKHVYQAAIKLYMSMQGDKQWLRKQLAVKEVVRSVCGAGMKENAQSERTYVRGLYEEMANLRRIEQWGHWRVLWLKSDKVVGAIKEVVGCVVENEEWPVGIRRGNGAASVMNVLSTVWVSEVGWRKWGGKFLILFWNDFLILQTQMKTSSTIISNWYLNVG